MQDVDYSEDSRVQDQFDGARKRHSDGQHNGRDAKRMDRGPKKPTLKILVPNLAVGKLIGKGGANIGELQTKHGASIEVSPSKDFFPGTNHRAVSISAEVDQIIEFVKYMIEEVQEDGGERDGGGRSNDFSLVITNSAVGFVMGKGGSTIKAIQDESGAGISICKQSESTSPGERMVTVSGTTEQKVRAVDTIIEKISVEPNRMSNPNTKYLGGDYIPKYGGGDFNSKFGGGFNFSNSLNQRAANLYSAPQDNGLRYSNTQDNTLRYSLQGSGNYDTSSNYEPKSKVKVAHFTTMEIPNTMVGSIVGKSGVTINEFSRTSGAQISFSGKDEFAPGTQDRILTIKGNYKQIQSAYMMIDQKVAQVEAEFHRPSYQQQQPY